MQTLELKPHHNLTQKKIGIYFGGLVFVLFGVCLFFAVLMHISNHRNITEKATAEGVAFFGVFTVLGLIALLFFIDAYRKAKQAQASDAPVVTFDENGITLHRQDRVIAWSEIESVIERIEMERNYYVSARLHLQLISGEPAEIDLLPLTGKHEETAKTARNYLRASRGIDLLKVMRERSQVTCPQCSEPTHSIKLIESGYLLFLVFFISARTNQFIGCPKCSRTRLALDIGINLLTANVLWPFYLLIVSLPQAFKVFSTGHNAKALETVLQQVSTETGEADKSG